MEPTELPVAEVETTRTYQQTRRMPKNIEGEPELNNGAWNTYERVAFRFFFLYFALQIVPLDWKYYRDLAALDWSFFHFSNLFYLARYAPRIFGEVPALFDWLFIALTALVGTVAWGIVDQKNNQYNNLYYWLRVALRYRLAAALLVYGFIKFFPMQMPEPSLSNLNTNYGDITHWKVFSLSAGIVPGYESFLGLVEIIAALLLLYRKTASIGAFIIIPFTGNVVMSNLAYEGGEFVYSLLLVSFALFILAYDVPRLLALTSFEKTTFPPKFKPVFSDSARNWRVIAKSSFIFVFVLLYGSRTYASYHTDIYQYPATGGLPEARGLYNVTQFKLNGVDYPYSPNDPVRWRDVVFEQWATLSVRSNKPVEIETVTTEEIHTKDHDRVYELSGIGGRHYYSYRIDSVNHHILLQNRNKNHSGDHFTLEYDRPSKDRIILSGVNSTRDSIHVVLDRIDKKYLLEEAAKSGRRRGLQL